MLGRRMQALGLLLLHGTVSRSGGASVRGADAIAVACGSEDGGNSAASSAIVGAAAAAAASTPSPLASESRRATSAAAFCVAARLKNVDRGRERIPGGWSRFIKPRNAPGGSPGRRAECALVVCGGPRSGEDDTGSLVAAWSPASSRALLPPPDLSQLSASPDSVSASLFWLRSSRSFC